MGLESPEKLDSNPFRFCGEYWDSDTETLYLRNRYYDPAIGRFTSEDPINDGLNWYTYCGGNPIMFVDPSGLSLIGLISAALIVVNKVTTPSVKATISSISNSLSSSASSKNTTNMHLASDSSQTGGGAKNSTVQWEGDIPFSESYSGYSSANDAAVDWSKKYYSLTESSGWEYASLIYAVYDDRGRVSSYGFTHPRTSRKRKEVDPMLGVSWVPDDARITWSYSYP